jgi:hypothetical protein
MARQKCEERTTIPMARERQTIKGPPEVYQVVIECRDEAEQRELFERMRREGLTVRLLVL